MNYTDDAFRRLILSAEISAMIHDLGKYSDLFLCASLGKPKHDSINICANNNSNASAAHTKDFFEKQESGHTELFKVLNHDWPVDWPQDDKKSVAPLRTFGDLARWHHTIGYYEDYFHIKEVPHLIV